MSELQERKTGGPRRFLGRLVRIFAGLLLGSLLGLLIAEGAFRFLLFSDSDLAQRWGHRLRKPLLFASAKTNSDYFKLKEIWDPPNWDKRDNLSDPKMGWLSRRILPPEYGHKDTSKLRGRRPFLMYGDSFTACMVPPRDSWQGLILRSPFKEELLVLNYGVCAYGLDQVYLMLRESLDLWVDLDPVVAVGILADDDLDRVVLDFRAGPKPYFTLENGELVVEYPGETDMGEWLEQNPPDISSYLLRYLTYGVRALPASWGLLDQRDPALIEEKQELSRALLVAIRAELEVKGVEYFFIVFEGPRPESLVPGAAWKTPFLIGTLDELEVPWVSTNLALERDRQKTNKVGNADYFIPAGKPGARHFSKIGNLAAVSAILRGLSGEYDGAVQK